MADPFESAWLKWLGGVVESHALADNVNAVAKHPDAKRMSMTLLAEYDPKRHCIVYAVVDFASPFPPFWGVMLGNIVHNFRSSLDHLAWAIYKRGRTCNLADKLERQVYFPIAETRTKFNNLVPQRLPGATRSDIAKVRLMQPYRVGPRNLNAHVIWLLDELARHDKHRVIQPVAPVPERAGIAIVGEPRDCIYRRLAPYVSRQVLEPGAEVARLYVKKTGPDPHIDVDPDFAVDPSINDRLTLEEFLRKTPEVIGKILTAFAPQPDHVAAIAKFNPPQRNNS